MVVGVVNFKKITNHLWCLLHLLLFLLIFGFLPLNIVLIRSHWSLTFSCSSSNPFPLHYTIVFLFIKLSTPPYNVFMFGPSSFHLLPFHHVFFVLKFILFLFIFQSLLPLALIIICLFEVFASMMQHTFLLIKGLFSWCGQCLSFCRLVKVHSPITKWVSS